MPPVVVLIGACFLLIAAPSHAQHFSDCLDQNDTGSSATVVLEDTIDVPLPEGDSLETGDEIALLTDDGVCAGQTTWDADASTITVAAAGPSGSSVDTESGYALDEKLRFTVWDVSADTEYAVGPNARYASCEDDALCRSDGRYENDVVFTVTQLGSETLPVEFTRLDATVEGRTATLRWSTASERNNVGFTVLHRPPESSSWTRRGFVDGHGTTTDRHSYRFSLSSLAPGQHDFRLRQVDATGTTTLSQIVSARVRMQDAYTLSSVVPNPVQDRGRLTLRVRTAQTVRVSLFNTLGQRIGHLHDGPVPAQTPHPIVIPGERLPSGSYFVRVRGESFSATRRVMIVR